MVTPQIRFSPLVRKALRFRSRFEEAKRAENASGLPWYPYDSFASLFYLQRLLGAAGLSLDHAAAGRTILDLGAGDGALAFFFESLGYRVRAVDFSGTNINRMQGIRALARHFASGIEIQDLDLDRCPEFGEKFGLTLLLGALYHLKNPFGVLENVAAHSGYCFLSTRVARMDPEHRVRLDGLPVAYLLGEGQCNSDSTNYWVFSPAGLERLASRAGWEIVGSATSGSNDSDPSSERGDERMFLLLRSKRAENVSNLSI